MKNEELIDRLIEMYNDAERVIKYTEDFASTEAMVDYVYEVRDDLQIILEKHAGIKFDKEN